MLQERVVCQPFRGVRRIMLGDRESCVHNCTEDTNAKRCGVLNTSVTQRTRRCVFVGHGHKEQRLADF